MFSSSAGGYANLCHPRRTARYTGRYKITGRGGKGHEFVSRGQIVEVMVDPVPAPGPLK